MTEDMIFDYGLEVKSATLAGSTIDGTTLAAAAAVLGVGGTFVVMYAASE